MRYIDPVSLSKKMTLSDAVILREWWRKKGKKVVFTNGCFDLLHAGHVCYLTQAKALGDILILGLNSDVSIQTIKGIERPVVREEDRVLVLSGLEAIHAIVVFEDTTPIPLLEQLKPDIHVKGGDYVASELPEYPLITSYGGEVKILPFRPGCSTSGLIQKILKKGL